MKIEHIDPSTIVVGERKRALRDDAVAPLVESVKRIGIRVPIAVRFMDDVVDSDGVISMGVPILVAGRHRLEAAKRLGLETVPVVEFCDETEARLWEIAENLHRSDLTKLERDEHLAEWIRLTEEKQVLSQVATKPLGGRPEGGVRAAARELGVSKDAAHRAVKVAGITEEAKQVAIDAGLADNGTALAAIAAAPADQQTEKAKELQRRKEARKAVRKAGDEIAVHDSEAIIADILLANIEADEIDILLSHFGVLGMKGLSRAVRRAQMDRHGPRERDVPVFDNTRAGAA